jgi:hypothetical protein
MSNDKFWVAIQRASEVATLCLVLIEAIRFF